MLKNKTGGTDSAVKWIIGLSVIALIGLIMLILFGNLQGNVGFGTTTTTFYNETVALSDTAVTPASAQNRPGTPTLSSVVVTNATGGETVPATNYTVSGVTITTVDNTYNQTNVNVSAVVTYDEAGKVDTDNMVTNYTTSVVNISEQFPTIGTIIGVALLLIVLIGVLVFAIRKLGGVSGSGAGSMSGSSGSKKSFERGGFG